MFLTLFFKFRRIYRFRIPGGVRPFYNHLPVTFAIPFPGNQAANIPETVDVAAAVNIRGIDPVILIVDVVVAGIPEGEGNERIGINDGSIGEYRFGPGGIYAQVESFSWFYLFGFPVKGVPLGVADDQFDQVFSLRIVPVFILSVKTSDPAAFSARIRVVISISGICTFTEILV